MEKFVNKPISFIGGPYWCEKISMDGCLKTHKFKVKDFIGHYERTRPDAHMIWKESSKRWYAIDGDVKITDEKLTQLGCWGVIESTSSRRYFNGKSFLVRLVGIDIESPFSAFELCFSENIKHIYNSNYPTVYDLRRNQ